jgi:uncharacterized protein HemY
MDDVELTGSDPLSAGQAALQRAEWQKARACFERAAACDATPEAFEGLSWACWWQDDFEPVVEARQAAFRLYRQRNDDLAAARMAMWLA